MRQRKQRQAGLKQEQERPAATSAHGKYSSPTTPPGRRCKELICGVRSRSSSPRCRT
jgi:hypothetical protein